MKHLGFSKRVGLVTILLIAIGGLVLAQSMADQVRRQALDAKEAAERNQKALHAYTWISKTELSLKGEVKNTKIESCTYGPDGKVQKTELTDPPEEHTRRGLRGRIAAKKTQEMKEELEASAALVQSYIPPTGEKLGAVISAGKVSVSQAGTDAVSLTFPDYNSSGDSLILLFDSKAKSLQKVNVNTWLEEKDKAVTLEVTFDSLEDGTNYVRTTVMQIPKDNIEVRIENSNYQKVAQ